MAGVTTVDHEGVRVIGPESRTLLAGPTKVGVCPFGDKLGVACDRTLGSASSGVAANKIISTESVVVDFVIFLRIFIGSIHPILPPPSRTEYNTCEDARKFDFESMKMNPPMERNNSAKALHPTH